MVTHQAATTKLGSGSAATWYMIFSRSIGAVRSLEAAPEQAPANNKAAEWDAASAAVSQLVRLLQRRQSCRPIIDGLTRSATQLLPCSGCTSTRHGRCTAWRAVDRVRRHAAKTGAELKGKATWRLRICTQPLRSRSELRAANSRVEALCERHPWLQYGAQ
eukprot:6194667-Pleurochrysis_carterae.AAC.1